MMYINDQMVDDDQACMIEALINNDSVMYHIDLANCKFTDSKKFIITKAMQKHSTLKLLNLSGISVTEDVKDILASLVAQNTELQYLAMARCELSDAFITTLAKVLNAHEELSHLNLSYNTFTNNVVMQLISALCSKAAFKHLAMEGCGFSRTQFLSSIRTLTALDLSNNPISDLYAGDVINLITKNTNLQHLKLSNCGFHSKGVLKILKVLIKRTNLLSLNMGSNFLTTKLETVASRIVAVITNNITIEEVHLPHGEFKDKLMESIFEAMQAISSLKCVVSSCNQSLNHHFNAVLNNLEIFEMDKLHLFQSNLKRLCDDLPKIRSLQHVGLYQCCISEHQLDQLNVMFAYNHSITHLSVIDCLFSDKYEDATKVLITLKRLKCLRHLDFSGVTFTEDLHIPMVVTANPGIELFSLANCKMPEIQKASLFKAFENTRGLEYFSINNMIIGELIGIENVFKNTSLQHLSLCNCKLQEQDVLVVCDAINTNSSLHHINLSGNNITNQAAEALSAGIAKNTILQHLELENCNLHGNGLKSICTVIKDISLKTLNLSHNCITDQVADELAHFIRKGCIENLQLKGCSLKHNGIKVLIKYLAKIKFLKCLDLSYNRISDTSLDLAAVLSCNTNLEHLDLSYCELPKSTMIKLFKARCTMLKVLNLNGNQIRDLASLHKKRLFLNAPCLQRLSLSKCHLQENGLIEILKCVKNSLEHFDVSFNLISDTSAKFVADVIQKNKDLGHLDLSNCQLNEKGLTLILKAVKSAQKLKFIDIKCNLVSNTIAEELALFMSDNHMLEHICLADCAIQEKGFLKIANALQRNLFHFDVNSNCITKNVATTLARSEMFIAESQLKCLDVLYCQWQEDSLKEILKGSMQVKNLKCMNFSDCKVNDEAARHMAASITTNKSLEHLVLTNCELQPTGLLSVLCAIMTLNALKHLEVKHLDLSSIQITKEVFTILAEVRCSNHIEHLDLSHCLIGANSFLAITAIVNNVTTLQYFDLSYNDISDDAAYLIASVIVANKYLHHLNFTKNQFDVYGITAILAAMTRINPLQYVNLGSYTINDDELKEVAISNHRLECIIVCKSGTEDVALERVSIASLRSVLLLLLCKN
ncbi:protein NLRC5-like [Dysidea avara]|uniref:protein NLRC5-like n=1 Tax=Dysidea avara TaxID=196820 RepID=UPI0033176A1E